MGWSGGDRRQAIGSMLPVPQIWRVLNPMGVPATPRMPHGVGGTRGAAKKPRPADRSRLLTPNWGSGGMAPLHRSAPGPCRFWEPPLPLLISRRLPTLL